MATGGGFLPATALEKVASFLLSGSDSQTGLLALMALAGVDRSSRRVIRRLRPDDTLVFDALESCSQKTLSRPMLPREVAFAKASPDAKAAFFLSAARLFKGYGEAAFVGQGVTDLLLLEVARKLQHGLMAVRLQVHALYTPVLVCPFSCWTMSAWHDSRFRCPAVIGPPCVLVRS